MTWNLMDKCCDRCWNSPEYPCRHYIRCRLNGPICHEDPDCRKRREYRLREITYGKHGFKIKIAMASCTIAAGAREVYDAITKEIKSRGIRVDVRKTGCMGMCYIDPWIELVKEDMPAAIYANVEPEDVSKIIKEYLEGDVSGAFALRYRTGKAKGEDKVPLLEELKPWKNQVRWVSRNCGIYRRIHSSRRISWTRSCIKHETRRSNRRNKKIRSTWAWRSRIPHVA